MADIVRYVNTASSAGGDGTTNNTTGATRAYASLNEWEAAEQTDLVTDTDTHTVWCDGAGGDDTTVTTVSGWTISTTYSLTIDVELAKAHSGIVGDGYTLSVSSNFNSALNAGTAIVKNVSLYNAGTGGGVFALTIVGIGQAHSVIGRCISGNGTCFKTGQSASRLYNCLSVDGAYGFDTSNFNSPHLYNCIATGAGSGFRTGASGSGPKLINCVGYGNTTNYDDLGSGWLTGSNYNAADDGSTVTPPGTNPITTDIVSGDFEDTSTDDFHLAGTGSTLYDAGVGPAADSNVPTVDVDGDTRSGTTTSIGFDEFVTAGITGTSTTTNADDTSNTSGTLEVSGTSTTTNVDDTSNASGALETSGVSNITNADNTSNAVGTLENSGTSITINDDDTSNAAGVMGTIITGTSETINANDISNISGTLEVFSISATTNNDDASNASGTLEASGNAATINVDDISNATGIVGVVTGITGTSAAANDNDFSRSSGIVGVLELGKIIKITHFNRNFKVSHPGRMFKLTHYNRNFKVIK